EERSAIQRLYCRGKNRSRSGAQSTQRESALHSGRLSAAASVVGAGWLGYAPAIEQSGAHRVDQSNGGLGGTGALGGHRRAAAGQSWIVGRLDGDNSPRRFGPSPRN